MLNELTGFYIVHRHAVLQRAHHQKAGFLGEHNNAGGKQKAAGKEEDQI